LKLNVALAVFFVGWPGHSLEHNTASTELMDLLGNLSTYRAEFEQVTRDFGGDLIETQVGRVVFSRIAGLRWQIDEPFSQVMVAKRGGLYILDLDLEQLTVANLRDLPDSAFALLLMDASVESIARFNVQYLKSADKGLDVGYVLQPTGEESVFQELRVYFLEGVMIRIEVVDHFDQQTDVLFRNPKANQVVELSEFEIVVPEGTDVIGDVTDRDPSG